MNILTVLLPRYHMQSSGIRRNRLLTDRAVERDRQTSRKRAGERWTMIDTGYMAGSNGTLTGLTLTSGVNYSVLRSVIGFTVATRAVVGEARSARDRENSFKLFQAAIMSFVFALCKLLSFYGPFPCSVRRTTSHLVITCGKKKDFYNTWKKDFNIPRSNFRCNFVAYVETRGERGGLMYE